MELQGYSTLKQVVSDVLIDKYNAIDQGRFFQLMRWAIRKYIDLKIYLLPENKAVKLSVISDPYCVRLPKDYVNFRAIGVDVKGEFIAFDVRPNMATYISEECGQDTQGENETRDVPPVTQWYTYSLQEENQRILLQGYPYLDEVILLYVSTGVEIGGETVVPAKIHEVLVSWLHYMLAKHAGGNGMELQEAWNTHIREINKYQKTKFKLDDMYKVLFNVANDKM